MEKIESTIESIDSSIEEIPPPPPPTSSFMDSPERPESPNFSPPNYELTSKSSTKINPKKGFEALVEFYLADITQHRFQQKTGELEVRFGTNPKTGKPLSKMDYDNVVQHFYSAGFTTDNADGFNMLRIKCEHFNKQKGQHLISNIRAEIMGIDLIQEYCRTNNLQKLIDLPSTISASSDKIKFTQKQYPFIGETRETSKRLDPVDFEDFNFRVTYQYEQDYYAHSERAKGILSSWLDTKKEFRYINRVRLRHDELPVFIDVSIVKSSTIVKRKKKTQRRILIPQYTIQDANVFNNEEIYEIELELDNSRIGLGTSYNTTQSIMEALRKCIRIVLSGIQGTNYPISNNEKEVAMTSYFETVFGEEYTKNYMERYNNKDDYIAEKAQREITRHFIGPSSYTLQVRNITQLPESHQERISMGPNIRENYTVTDKADGDRKLLYIASNGHIYMIDTNMNIIFTGLITTDKELFNSVLDGEHIKYDKHNKFVNLYAAFDIYFINKKSVRELNFVAMDERDVPEKFRLPLLNNYVKQLKPRSILNKDLGNSDPSKGHGKPGETIDHSCWLNIKCKKFSSSYNGDIFKSCDGILSRIKDGSYEYNTDGLIFTPASMGVGGTSSGKAGPLQRITWEHSFKWKPAHFNTIDFLVTVKKDENNQDEIHNVFQDGIDLQSHNTIAQYKTLILKCGFSRKDHGYINPMLNIINDDLPDTTTKNDFHNWRPEPFKPTNPSDDDAQYCNVELKTTGNGKVMMTKENEYFEENMIVEFSYDKSKEGFWRWVPLRVRYDKTNDLRITGRNFGNGFHVADSNWHSIHNPITEEMIMTGMNIPGVLGDDDVYYNRSGKKTTVAKSLRNFHNYVKKKLIVGTGNRGDTLIDYAVGVGGDLYKWIEAKLDFVFGIDYSKDNIENHKDGACARYLDLRLKYNPIPGVLFAHGNSGANIRNGSALISERDKQISNAVFGNGGKDKEELGDGVYKRFGIGKDGFNVSSCQFAIHYFFGGSETQNGNLKILHSFLRNVSECTKVNGYFIGTCYDGETVFNILKDKSKGESITIYSENDRMYELTKQYSHTGFPEDEYSLGYGIDIYQESINPVKEFREYLVNFKYLQRAIENYGFTLLTKEEANAINLPNGSGIFDELFAMMKGEIKRNFKDKREFGDSEKMTTDEKQISFMNRYFVFRKTHNVNAEKVYKLLVNNHRDDITEDDDVDDVIGKLSTLSEKEDNAKETTQSIVIRKIPGKKIKLTIGEKQLDDENSDETELTLKSPTRVIIKKKKK